MFTIAVNSQHASQLVQAYLFSKECTHAGTQNIREFPHWAHFISVDEFKRIGFDERHYHEGYKLITPTELFDGRLDFTVIKVGHYLVHPTKHWVKSSQGSKFTRKQVLFCLSCLKKKRTPRLVYEGHNVSFRKNGDGMRVGCTRVSRKQLEEIIKIMN